MSETVECLADAELILEHAESSLKAFRNAFDTLKRQRGAKRGMTTDEEQDVLRAAVVFAAAGLDAVAKQLIRDALPGLLEKDPKVQAGLETFVARRIRGDDDGEGYVGAKFLARLLTAQSQRGQVIEEYIRELTGSSLQSPDELLRTAAALGVDPAAAGIERKALKPIFDVRNKIIHELDIDLAGARRKRNIRGQDVMLGHAGTLLVVARQLVASVETRLSQPS